MRFSVFGHENVRAEHPTTIEFTAENHLSQRGDCILGVGADWKELAALAGKLRIRMSLAGLSDELVAYANPGFRCKKCMVIRTSAYTDYRTFAVRASKAASSVSRRLVEAMKKPSAKMSVAIEPVRIKGVIFDLDSTLEEWTPCQKSAEELLAEQVSNGSGVKPADFLAVFRGVRRKYEARTLDPLNYGRDRWIADAFRELGIKASAEKIGELERLYWRECHSRVRLFPGVGKLLRRLKLKKAILTDADGRREIKMERIRLLGLESLVDCIVTSNDTGRNKPHPSNFLKAAELLGLRPDECLMAGDKPEADLITAKALGMTTVLVRQGEWSHSVPYADFEIDSVVQLIGVLAQLKTLNSSENS